MKFFAAILIGVVCLYYVTVNFNWRQIWESLQTANLALFFSASTATLLIYFFIRTLRWYFLLKNENLNVPFVKLYLYNSISIGLSTVTPFQSGEAFKVELMRKYGGARLSGYTIFFLERFFDLLVIIGLGILGASFGFDFGVPRFYFYAFAAVLIAAFLAIIGVVFLLPSERLNPIKVLLQEKRQQKRVLLLTAFLTVLSWTTVILGWKAALASVSIDISFMQTTSLMSLTTLLSVLSFVPGAVGVSELGITTILTKMGVELSSAQTGAIAVRAYTLMILGLTLLHWLILKFLSERNKKIT